MPGLKDFSAASVKQLYPRERVLLSEAVKDCAISPIGNKIAATTADGKLHLLTPKNIKNPITANAHDLDPLTLTWSPDGRYIATTSYDGIVKFFSAEDLRLLKEIPFGRKSLDHAAWSPTGRLAIAMGSQIFINDFAENRSFEIDCGDKSVTGINFESDEEIVFTSYAEAKIIDVRHEIGKVLNIFQYPEAMLKLELSQDRRFAAIICQDNVVRIWVPKEDNALQMGGYEDKIKLLTWNDAGRYLAIAGGTGISIWDFAGDGPEGNTPINLIGHSSRISTGSFLPSSSVLLSCEETGPFALWDVENSRSPIAFAHNKSMVLATAQDPCLSFFVTGDIDGSIALWSLPFQI